MNRIADQSTTYQRAPCSFNPRNPRRRLYKTNDAHMPYADKIVPFVYNVSIAFNILSPEV